MLRRCVFRVKADQIESLAAYEYFAGSETSPRWSGKLEEMKPVFTNPAGVSWGSTCVYHEATGRYLLSVGIHTEKGDWGLYESQHLWGPWRTVAYGGDFPQWTYASAEKNRPAYVHSFPAKWISIDGKSLWCVFDRGDHFNLARCTLGINAPFQLVVVDAHPPHNPWVKLAGDFNGDGKLDIAIGGQAGPLVWYANPDWRKFQIAEGGWSTVGGAVGDVHANGFKEKAR